MAPLQEMAAWQAREESTGELTRGDLDTCLLRHAPALVANRTFAQVWGRLMQSEKVELLNRGEPFPMAPWRSPRRDVMLVAGVLCWMGTPQAREAGAPGIARIGFSEEQSAVLGALFSRAADPEEALSLDALAHGLVGLL
jgi:hypothetical protein